MIVLLSRTGVWPAGSTLDPVSNISLSYLSASGPFFAANERVVLIQRDSQCDPAVALLELDSAIKECRSVHRVDPSVIIGPGCSTEVLQTRRLAEFYGIAMVSWGAGNPIFSDKAAFPLFLRSTGPTPISSAAYVQMFSHFGWNKTALLSSDSYSQFHKILISTLEAGRIEVTLGRVFITGKPAEGQEGRLKKALAEVRDSGTRVVIMMGLAAEAREFAVAVHSLGLKGGWAFLVADLTVNTWEGDAGWLGSAFQAEARAALEGCFGVVPGLEDTPRLRSFAAELAASVPAAERDKIDLSYASYLYDAVQMWGRGRASALKALRAQGLTRRETAAEVIEAARSEKFDGMAGPVEVENNDRLTSFLVTNFNGTSLQPVWMWSTARGLMEVRNGSSQGLLFPGPSSAVPSSQAPPDPGVEEARRVEEHRRRARNLAAKASAWVAMLLLWLAVWVLGRRLGFTASARPPETRGQASRSVTLPNVMCWVFSVWELLQFLSFVVLSPREGVLLSVLGSIFDEAVAYGIRFIPRVYCSYVAALFVIALSAPIAFFALCSSSPLRRASLKRFSPLFRRWLSAVTPLAPFYFPFAEVLFGTVINTLVRLFECVPVATTAANGTEYFLASALKDGGQLVKCWKGYHTLLCSLAALVLAPLYILQVAAQASVQLSEPNLTILFSPAGLFAVKQAKVFIVCLVIGFHRGKTERMVTLAICAALFLFLVWATRGSGPGRAFCTDHRMTRFRRSSFLLGSLASLAMLLNTAGATAGSATLTIIGVGLALLIADTVASLWDPRNPDPAILTLLFSKCQGPPQIPPLGTTSDKEVQVG